MSYSSPPRHQQGTVEAFVVESDSAAYFDTTAEPHEYFDPTGMGVAFADYDGDGYLDMFVANDTVPNFLFHNERNGTFREVFRLPGRHRDE